jgi:hypothetical protein
LNTIIFRGVFEAAASQATDIAAGSASASTHSDKFNSGLDRLLTSEQLT